MIQRVEERLSAIGNCIACNDHTAFIHAELDRETEEIIADVLGVEVRVRGRGRGRGRGRVGVRLRLRFRLRVSLATLTLTVTITVTLTLTRSSGKRSPAMRS